MLDLIESLSNFRLQAVACFLGISQQHRRVGLVEYGVVHCSVAHTKSTLHHDHLMTDKMLFASSRKPPNVFLYMI